MASLKRILFVEDDMDVQMIGKYSLEITGGFEIQACSSGAEALDEVELFAPHLFLLDVMMPEMDGIETLQRLRKIEGHETTPVIFMTAKCAPEDIEEYIALGALHVIPKPFDAVSLATQIKDAWSKAQT